MKSRRNKALFVLPLVVSLVSACAGAENSNDDATVVTEPTSETVPAAEGGEEVASPDDDAPIATIAPSIKQVPTTIDEERRAFSMMVADVMRQAAESDEFNSAIKADPIGVLAGEGFTVSNDESIRVLESTVDSVLIILDDRNVEKFYPEILDAAPGKTNETQQLLRDVRTRAQTDDVYREALLSDTEATLLSEGMGSEVAGRFTVVDYEPDTDFFLLLPPPNPENRVVWELVIKPIVTILREVLKGVVGDAAAAIGQAAWDAFALVEGACFFPRLFGQPCGVSRDRILQFMTDEVAAG